MGSAKTWTKNAISLAAGSLDGGELLTHRSAVQYRDWSETRRLRWVGIVALLTVGTLLGLSVLFWGPLTLLSPDGDLLVSLTALVGIVLHLYVFQRIGVKIV